jgi:hypothetical protein
MLRQRAGCGPLTLPVATCYISVLMKKIKSPWYGALWILIWTAGVVWFLVSGMFTVRESVGLVIVWAILVGITLWLIVKQLRMQRRAPAPVAVQPKPPALNAPCPCGSGKKFKRCCGAD